MLNEAVEIKDLVFVYPDGSKALNGVSLSVSEGERVAIIGPNGAGKSTLLMLINGLFTSSSGTVNVFGLPVERSNLSQVRRRVGLVFQNPDDQLFCPTLWEDVTFGPLNMGLSKEEVEDRAKAAMKAVGLEDFGDRPPHHLSLGEKRRAAIATVLAMQPSILVLDEPTANLDPLGRVKLLNILDRLHQDSGITLITATCDIDLVPLVADKIYLLNRGRIVGEGPVKEVLSNLEVLQKAELQPSTITKLFATLRSLGVLDFGGPLPITVEEAVAQISSFKEELNLKRHHREKRSS